MELAIDAILIFAAVFCIWAGTRKGFVRSVMGLVNTVVSAVAAYAFTPRLAPYFENLFMSGRLVDDIEGELNASRTVSGFFNLDALLTDLPSWFTDFLSRYHLNTESVAELMKGVTEADGTSLRNLSERLAYPTASALAHAVSYAILFIGAFLVMSILTAVLDAIFRMPVLNGANMFFGFLVGVLEGLVLISVLALVLDVGVRALGAFDPSWFGDKAVDNTILCRFLVQHSPLSFLTNVLK